MWSGRVRLSVDSSVCGRDLVCQECGYMARKETRYMQKASASDLSLIGLFNVHSQGASPMKPCGSLRIEGFMNMLAFFYGLNSISEGNFMQYGGLAIDTCSSPERSQADMFSFLSGRGLCDSEDSEIQPNNLTIFLSMGNANSKVATSLLKYNKHVVVDPIGNVDSFKEKTTLVQTGAPKGHQAKIMSAIAEHFGWKYVTLISSDNEFDENIASFLKNGAGTCIAMKSTISADNSAKTVVKSIKKNEDIKVILLITSGKDTEDVLKELSRENKDYVIIGGDSLGLNPTLIRKMHKVLKGGIVLQPWLETDDDFQVYYRGLSLENRNGIPRVWFEEFWQYLHSCHIKNSLARLNYPVECDMNLAMPKMNLTVYGPAVTQTLQSVKLVGEAMRELAIKECGTSKSVSSCLMKIPDVQEKLKELISTVRISTKSGGAKFYAGRKGYDVYNIQGLDISDFKLVKVRLGSVICPVIIYLETDYQYVFILN